MAKLTKKEKEEIKNLYQNILGIIKIIIKNKNRTEHLSIVLKDYTINRLTSLKERKELTEGGKYKMYTIEQIEEIKESWFYKEALDMFDYYKIKDIEEIESEYKKLFQNEIIKNK